MNSSKLGQKKRLASQKNKRNRKRSRLNFQRRLTTESLENRELLAGDTMALHNAGLPLDTNNDGQRSSLDVLLVVNDLNRYGSRDVVVGEAAAGLVDTNGDGVVSAVDALGIVNYLNRGQGEGDAKVQVRLAATARDSMDVLSSVGPGEDFMLRAFVTDLTDPAEGVFSGFVDVNYQANLANVDGQIIHPPEFPNGTSGDVSVDGVMDEVGSFSGSFAATGPGEMLLFSVPMTAEQVGTLQFTGNPPDVLPAHEFTLFGENEGVLGEEIMFVNTTLNIVDENAPTIPTANDDAGYVVDEDNTLTVNAAEGVLANDLPADATLTVEVLSNVQNGTLQLNSDGSFTYVPNENFNGEDSFTYIPSNGDVPANTPGRVTITVNAVNDAPVAIDDAYTTEAGVTLIRTEPDVGLLANDNDVEGETLTLLTDQFEGVENGILTASPAGGIAYIPDPGFVGTDTFTYVIQDASGAISNRATVTIVVTGEANTAPIAVDDSYTTEAGVTLVATQPEEGLLANDTDADGDTLTLLTDLIEGANNGILTASPAGGIAYIPDPGFVGTDTFTYVVQDPSGAISNRATVTIEVTGQTNNAPVGVADEYTIMQNMVLDVDAPGVLENDSDPNGDNIVAQLLTQPANGTVILGTSGALRYTPDDGFFGVDTFTYQVADGPNTSEPVTVTITVEEDDPFATAPIADDDAFTMLEDTVLTVDAPGVLANDSDFDGSPLTAVLKSEPSNGTLNLNADGSLTYTPDENFNGTDTFTYDASDGVRTDSATVTITVEPVSDSPITQPETYIVQFETELTVGVENGLLVNDSDVDSPVLTALLAQAPANGVAVVESDGSFTYTPDDGYSGTDSFIYAVQDGSLTTLETATLEVQPPDVSNALVAFRVAVTDSAGTELTELQTGDSFVLRVFVEDVSSDDPQQGVFAAYTDVVWEGSKAVVTGALNHGSVYVNDPSGTTSSPGLIDEAGGFDGLEPVGGDELLVFSVPMRATGEGELTFSTDPADISPFSDVLLFVTKEERTPTDRIRYGSTTVTVEGLSEPVANADSYDTDDGTLVVSAGNGVLRNDLPAAGGGGLTAVLVDEPANGSVTLNADGSFTYVANTGFAGTDTFTYRAAGVANSSVPATVSINVEDPAPNSVSGTVYFDSTNNGFRDAGEHAFGGVKVTLTGTTVFGEPVQRTATTTGGGAYAFNQIPAGSYVVSQQQPAIVIDGIDRLNGEIVSDSVELDLTGGQNLTLNFGERGLQPRFIGNPLFSSTRISGGVGIGVAANGQASWYCLDSGWDGVRSVNAQVSTSGSSVTITAVDQAGNTLVGTVPVSNRNVRVRGDASSGYFVELTDPLSAYNLQRVVNAGSEAAIDAVFAL